MTNIVYGQTLSKSAETFEPKLKSEGIYPLQQC